MTENDNKAIVTIRLIRSFEHRNIKNLVLKDVDLSMTIRDFKSFINEGKYLRQTKTKNILQKNNIYLKELKKSTQLPVPFRNFAYDTLKIEHQPFKFKTPDPIINTQDDDKLILRNDNLLKESNIGKLKITS